MQLHFILVNPARGENVGFAARALKTLGFSSMRIVGEPLQHSESARKTGYGSHDILDNCQVFSNLEQALSDIDLSIGTTAKERIKRYDNHAPRQVTEILKSKKDHLQQVGIVFGSEENGLSTEELDQCDLISTIPLATQYPSLNLAQSVLIYAWEMRACGQHNRTSRNLGPANPSLQRLLKEETGQLLQSLGIADKPILAQRIMDRVLLLGSEDSELLMTVLNKLSRKH